MFELGKILWWLGNPASLLFLLLCAGSGLLFTRRWRLGRLIVAIVVIAGAGLSAAPISAYLLHILEQRFPRPAPMPPEVHGIILLGGDLDQYRTLALGEPVVRDRGNRLLAFAHLARRYPDARLVFTGGAAELRSGAIPEAKAMPLVLEALDIDPHRVTLEDQSRNTQENAAFTKMLIDPSQAETWLVVTSAAHIPRAVGCFRRVGWDVVPYPVDYQGSSSLSWRWPRSLEAGIRGFTDAAREYVGLAVYRMLGHTDELFPAP